MNDEEEGWLTFPVDVTPKWSNQQEIVYKPFPRAVVWYLGVHGSFTPKSIDVDIDEFGQWKVTANAWYYGNENLPFKWHGVGLTFEDAQEALIRFMDGWWFERDLA